MFMSQCLKERNGERIGDSTGDVNGRIAADKVVGYFNAPRGHPDLSIRNMGIMPSNSIPLSILYLEMRCFCCSHYPNDAPHPRPSRCVLLWQLDGAWQWA